MLPLKLIIVSLLTYMDFILDLFGNATAEANCFADTVLESSCSACTLRFCAAVSSRNASSAASFRRGLLINKAVIYG